MSNFLPLLGSKTESARILREMAMKLDGGEMNSTTGNKVSDLQVRSSFVGFVSGNMFLMFFSKRFRWLVTHSALSCYHFQPLVPGSSVLISRRKKRAALVGVKDGESMMRALIRVLIPKDDILRFTGKCDQNKETLDAIAGK